MNELDVRKEEELTQSFELAQNFVNKNYLMDLSHCKVVPVPNEINNLTIRDNIRLFKINKIVYDKNENGIDKLSNVYNALGNVNASLIVIINSDRNNTDMYIGTRLNTRGVNSAKEAIEKSLKGNFPGTEIENLKNSKIENLIKDLMKSEIRESNKIISCVSGIPSLKDDNKDRFVQGIEKFVDAMKGEKFSAIFIADPIKNIDIENIKSGYENLYSRLVPFANTELNFSATDSEAVTEGLTKGVTITVSESLTKTQSHTSGYTKSTSRTDNKSTTKSMPGALGAGGATVGGIMFGPVGVMVGGAMGSGLGSIIGSSTKGESNTYSSTKNNSDTQGTSEQKGNSKSDSIQENKSTTSTVGNSKSLQIKFENKSVIELLEKIDEQLKRIRESENFRMWNCASYFIANDVQTSKVAASTFKALMRGENSAIEKSFINTWDNNNKNNLIEVSKYIEKLNHPLIDLNVNIGMNVPNVTPGSLISGKELAIQFGLPKKSISGVPVIEMAEFGRNIITYDNGYDSEKIKIGKIFHMSSIEDTDVEIDLNSLAMHTFVTGSTGSGKSNTIYKLLNGLNKKNVKFLVIEPAKGEYKEVFGGRKDIYVFGTNPKYCDLLKINPFKFPEDIHVLEHIDRLLEIFNACWPMYAAMPAVLKEAIEMAYEIKGWDLDYSINVNETYIYPTFEDLLETLAVVINNSSYSQEVKSNYSGALITRVKSLTNGLLGRIFNENEIDSKILFDENVIVDLSRIGSVETKSLITGILFIKLQEYRFSNTSSRNSNLKHVTVLEEAHNLLRRTSFDQNQEGTNLQGKSVEMISNSIAEMRTYGEGFIIADQAPNLLDQSVIRNTNTKIILRLPEELDRQTVGKSASLNEDQINEIPKLKTGVAVVYQNNWIQPILCKIDEFKIRIPFVYNRDFKSEIKYNKRMMGYLLKILLNARVTEENKIDLETIDLEKIGDWLKGVQIGKESKYVLEKDLQKLKLEKTMDLWKQENFELLSKITTEFLDKDKLIRFASKSSDFTSWNEKFLLGLRKYVDLNENEEFEKSLMQCLIHQKAADDESFKDFYFKWVENVKIDRGELNDRIFSHGF
ncbi:AAA-like domain protein [Clostridium tepidiprofundi DSM 19306]|uniref:AAA-like domain protein n=1 Tax=Clostridium tepidiprofundi DSM 19306 TaxID=1121338 RepID=A0A151AVG0_9CLOT|nr:ATP-binding protein [Clostridium tepidiprofundi]KYH31387.1 AAA-like domain protein [Clostridium tepidiprofundi DSM 19306]